MIADDMVHGLMPRPPRRRIQNDTPIVPRAVAEAVCEEACVWLGESLPPEWTNRLAARANLAYTRSAQFRRMIRRGGDSGRDWLWAFTRHWLAAMIRRRSQRLYARLPAAYSTGASLPHQPLTPATRNARPDTGKDPRNP